MSNQIIDANFAEVTESLKTLEDIARFELEVVDLALELKKLRNKIELNYQNIWLLERDLSKTTERELDVQKHFLLIDVIKSNCRKAAQSLKTISEMAHLKELPGLAVIAEEASARVYNIEKELWLAWSNYGLKSKLKASQLYFITGRAENEPFESIVYKVKQALAGGVQIIQLREKGLEASQICYLGSQIRELCNKSNALFIVNDRPDIALAVEADGVHIGNGDIDIKLVRQIVGKNKLIGVSVHSQEEILAYENSEADYLSVGPIYPTITKAGRPPVGIELVRWANDNIVDKPWFAVGGINLDNIGAVLAAGAKRFAFIKYFMDSPEQSQAAAKLKSLLINTAEEKTLVSI
jgi:thiamine-phosphate pyrophosphorylase